MRWWKGALGIERDADGHESKGIIGASDGLAEWAGSSASRQDGTNFRTNMVTLADFQDNHSMGEEAILGLTAVWACVNLLAGTISSLPLMVYRTKDGQQTAATDHPLYRVLHESPNADQTSLDYMEFVAACIELRGNAYSEIERRNDDSVIALDVPIPPQLVLPRRASNGQIEYQVLDGRRTRVIPQDRMLHVRGFGGSPLGGLSTLAFGCSAFRSALAVERAASATFRQGARSVGAFVADKQLNATQMGEAEERVSEKYLAAVSAGRPLILNNGFQWHALSINPDDAQMLESRSFSVEEICRLFGTPPHMIGHTAGNTQLGSSITEQTRGFEKFTLRRRVKRIEQAAMKQLLTPRDRAEGITIEFNMEGLLRGAPKERADFYRAALGDTQKPGWMVRNEIRKLEKLPPVEGWDDPIPLISGPADSSSPDDTAAGEQENAA